MKFLFACLSALAFCSVSQAAQIQCHGAVFGYNVHVHTSTHRGTVAGDILVTITRGSHVVKSSTLRVQSSSLVPRQTLEITGRGPDGSGHLSARFNPATGTYDGTINAQTGFGELQVDLSCALQGLMSVNGFQF